MYNRFFWFSLNLDPVKELLKIRFRIYILKKNVIILMSFAPPFSNIERNSTYPRFSYRCITYSIRIGNLDWCKCQKQQLELFYKKGILKKYAKFTGKHLCQSLFFNKIVSLRQRFLQNNPKWLLLKCGHCKNEAKEIDCLWCREVDAMLTASTKIPEHEGSMSPSRFYWHLPDY